MFAHKPGLAELAHVLHIPQVAVSQQVASTQCPVTDPVGASQSVSAEQLPARM